MMYPLHCRSFRTTSLALALSCGSLAPAAAETPAGWVEPVYRVAYETEAATGPTPQQGPAPQQAPAAAASPAPAQVASRIVQPMSPPPAFNLEQLPGEHPLMPALRVAQEGVQHIDQTIRDYSAILYKQERIDGELGDQEVAFIRVRHQPFAVHMFFLAPNKGRECLYLDGLNGEKGVLHARDCGFRRKLGVFKLDPDGRLAMAGQKYPITKVGIRNLTTELIAVASNDVNYGECEVRTAQTEIGPANGEKRPVTLIEVIHPTPRRNFRFHKAQIFIDNELRVPIRYASYMWPERAGEQPPLEEAYTYLNLKLNNGFTDADFSPENPELFKD
ncbi:MAG: hypothetical protein DCC67_15235 [Planctomycetota bacterium]|nr:MAG: hypothetical protein DCC67_15235 [Planctomycetota bacterium]